MVAVNAFNYPCFSVTPIPIKPRPFARDQVCKTRQVSNTYRGNKLPFAVRSAIAEGNMPPPQYDVTAQHIAQRFTTFLV